MQMCVWEDEGRAMDRHVSPREQDDGRVLCDGMMVATLAREVRPRDEETPLTFGRGRSVCSYPRYGSVGSWQGRSQLR